MAQPSLTILLPLRGRHLYTLRFLWHANRTKLPYPILVADGLVHPTVARLLENPATFPNLAIEYVRYPDDASPHLFWQKMADASARIRTPYVMNADNDDFLAPAAMARSVAHLDAHSDHVCAGSGIAGFELLVSRGDSLPNVSGTFNHLQYPYRSRDTASAFEEGAALTRASRGVATTWLWYSVTRTEAAADLWRDVAEIDFGDIHLAEYFLAMRHLALGKARANPAAISYIRQYRTSLGHYLQGMDWALHLLTSDYKEGFDRMIARLSSMIAEADHVEQGSVERELRAASADKLLRPYLLKEYGTKTRAIRLKIWLDQELPHLRSWLKRAQFVAGRGRASLLAQLRTNGADEGYLSLFARELGAIEETVSGSDLIQFLETHAPDLVAAARSQQAT